MAKIKHRWNPGKIDFIVIEVIESLSIDLSGTEIKLCIYREDFFFTCTHMHPFYSLFFALNVPCWRRATLKFTTCRKAGMPAAKKHQSVQAKHGYKRQPVPFSPQTRGYFAWQDCSKKLQVDFNRLQCPLLRGGILDVFTGALSSAQDIFRKTLCTLHLWKDIVVAACVGYQLKGVSLQQAKR